MTTMVDESEYPTALDCKRFALPKAEELRGRLDQLSNGLSRLQEEHPEVIDATLFGSMVKGTATPESDIDGFVFVEELGARPNLKPADWEWARKEQEQARATFRTVL